MTERDMIKACENNSSVIGTQTFRNLLQLMLYSDFFSTNTILALLSCCPLKNSPLKALLGSQLVLCFRTVFLSYYTFSVLSNAKTPNWISKVTSSITYPSSNCKFHFHSMTILYISLESTPKNAWERRQYCIHHAIPF